MARPSKINFTGMQNPVDSDKKLDSFQVGFRNEKESDSGMPELLIFDTIGYDWWTGEGVTASSVEDFLSANAGKDIKLRVNSGGGDVFEGIHIFNLLVHFDGHVTGEVEALAFSAASFIAMAADTLKIHETADFGIHMASTGTWGNKLAHQNQIEWLERIDEQILAIYTARGSVEQDELNALYTGTDNDGTLMTAAEALANGFVDEIIPIPTKTTKKDDEVGEPTVDDNHVHVSFTNSDDSEVTIRHRRIVTNKSLEPIAAVVETEPVVDEGEARLVESRKKQREYLNRVSKQFRDQRLQNIQEKM